MAAESSWSLRGVDPKAREAARTAARKEGLTIGEWLNRQLLEDQKKGRGRGVETGDLDDEAGGLAAALDRLSRRIEAAEHRSTLAITGIDQSVLGLISRLQNAEELHSTYTERYDKTLADLKDTQQALHTRIEQLESDDTGAKNLKSLKTLEAALDKLAKNMEDADGKAAAKLQALETSLGEVSARVERSAEGLSEKLDASASAAEARIAETRAELDKKLKATAPQKTVSTLETRVAEIAERLGSAEDVTNSALKALEGSFGKLETRMREAEDRLAEGPPDVKKPVEQAVTKAENRLAKAVEKRFDELSGELSVMIAETRADIAKHLENAAAAGAAPDVEKRLTEVSKRVAAAEKRHTSTLSRIGSEIAKLAGAVERRIGAVELRGTQGGAAASNDDIDRIIETRLREIEASGAHAVARVGEEVTRVAASLRDEIQEIDRRGADAIGAFEERITSLSDRMDAAGLEDEEALARRIEAAEARTAQMVDEALAEMTRRVEHGRDQTFEQLSPVQRALASLALRLEEIEGIPPAAQAAPGPETPVTPETAPASAAPPHDDRVNFADDPPPFDAEAVQPNTPDAPPFDEEDQRVEDFVKRGHAKQKAPPPPADEYPDDEPDDDDHAHSDFLAVARRAAQASAAGAAKRGRAKDEIAPGFGPAPAVERGLRGRRLWIAASGAAFVAVGAAAALLMVDSGRRDAGPTLPDADGLDDGARAAVPKTPVYGPPAPEEIVEAREERSIVADGLEPAPVIEDYAVDAAAVATEAVETAALEEEAPVEAAPVVVAEPDVEVIVEPEPPAVDPMIAAAEAGDPVAQFQLAMSRLREGDADIGVAYLRQAAENGLPQAQYRLGKMYETGQGVRADIEEARRWTERAANAGHRKAMHNLGILYAEGRGAAQDFETAAHWFEQAALIGATDSQYNLAVLYEQGLGVPTSLTDAYTWFAIAARSGDVDAGQRAQALAPRLSTEEVAAADARAIGFTAKAPAAAANADLEGAAAPATRPVAAVARAQTLLASLGFDAGPADGAVGPKTREAVEAYRSARGLEVTGRIDADLIQRLESDTER